MKWQIYPPPILASTSEEWKYHNFTVRARIGRRSGTFAGRSNPHSGIY